MSNLERDKKKNITRLDSYSRTQHQKEMIIARLKEKGFRVTMQREVIIDIILQDECDSCKEIYYKAIKRSEQIGIATVYRLVNILEEIGAINRRSLYRVDDLEVVQEMK